MYEKILNEIKLPYYQQQFPNNGQRFVAWYLRNIHGRDEIQAKADITDGADDKQIDAIFVDDEYNKVYIIQGKFIGGDTVNAEPIREVLSSWVQLKDLVRLQETANNKLKQKLAEVVIAFDDNYDIEFELITTSNLTEQAQRDLFTFQKELAESEDLSANLRLIDIEELQHRYDYALEKENPVITHTLALREGKFIKMDLAGTNVIMASLPLKDCLAFPGIKDGTLSQKNVRQSLGLSNHVNKGIKNTIYNESRDFFFFHNGITALCNKMIFDNSTKQVTLKGLSIVNGCQSLNTILSCSEKVKILEDSFIMFRFYEIPERDRADRISISTNSQSSIKPRDLRSNDKRVLNLKRAFEQKYPQGYLKTKRGETLPANKNKDFELDLSDLAKLFVSWHSQRPNIAYGETKLFDKYFDQLFRKDYQPENAQALNMWMRLVWKRWTKDNPLSLNESLLVMRAYAPYHHLYAISNCFVILNKMPQDNVPSPSVTFNKAEKSNLLDQLVDIAGSCLNSSLEAAANEPLPNNRVFSPQNWIKTKTCLADIRKAINLHFTMLPSMPGGKELLQKLKLELQMESSEFTERWAAD
ncbi:hypothetical protein AGMMS50268_27310 [Spirochaetia bacterium]|nr:hypothetical protein AGMMS50268_27310 [Spirochaetia bacterium]